MSERYFHYKRAKFSAQLEAGRLYTVGHLWLDRQEESFWRVGFTEFAIRALGEPVDLDFEVSAGASIRAGQVVGWIEGFKAITDLYSPLGGHFRGGNPELDRRIGLVQSEPYGRGWLYAVEGAPANDCLDVRGYAAFLDDTIGRVMGAADGCAR